VGKEGKKPLGAESTHPTSAIHKVGVSSRILYLGSFTVCREKEAPRRAVSFFSLCRLLCEPANNKVHTDGQWVSTIAFAL